VFFRQERLTFQASLEPLREKRRFEDRQQWEEPRVTEHQSLEQAAAMAERFQRMYLRSLRALCNLRKVPLSVIVQNAGQVNVGGQPVNLAEAGG
jgi:alpha-galactosidase/6-phospho-beta-glucosidase family protein